MRVEVAGEMLTLLPDRAVWWESRATLLVADMHLGKGAAFRAAGIPVPEGTTTADIERLNGLVSACGARRIVILGDLLHAADGRSDEVCGAFSEWRRRCGVPIMLVRGNHDAHAGDPPADWDIECQDGPVCDGPFVFAHEPSDDPRGPVLCGHIHPAARLIGRGDSMRVACYWLQPGRLVLPAFGSFTGMRAIRPRPGDRVFAAGTEVIEIGLLSPR